MPSRKRAARNAPNNNRAPRSPKRQKPAIPPARKPATLPKPALVALPPPRNPALPPIGSLVYAISEHFEARDRTRRYGHAIYAVTGHGADARGPFAVAVEMRTVGIPVQNLGPLKDDGSMYAVDLVPHGVLAGNRRVELRAGTRAGTWIDGPAGNGQAGNGQAGNGQETFRVLPYGTKVREMFKWDVLLYDKDFRRREKLHAMNVTNDMHVKNIVDRWQRSAAKRKVDAARARVAGAAQDPLVRAALDTPFKIMVTAHGSIIAGHTPFTVPRGVVLVFLTAPGAFAYSKTPPRNAREEMRRMILGTSQYYTAPYFEGDVVSEHRLEFASGIDIGAGISEMGGPGVVLDENDRKEWNRILRNSRGVVLSELVEFLRSSRGADNRKKPLVVFLGICRRVRAADANRALVSNENEILRHANRDRAARSRVVGPGRRAASSRNLVRRGEGPYLRNMYADPRMKQLIDYMRRAGIVTANFKDA